MHTRTHHVQGGRRALALVFLAAVIEGFELQAAGVAIPRLAPEFGLTPNQIGLFFSSATFGLILGALIGGPGWSCRSSSSASSRSSPRWLPRSSIWCSCGS